MGSTHRLFIDESGDHTYRHLEELARRYLGITGVLVRKDRYDPAVPDELERLKKSFFHYDPDSPPILTRKAIVGRKSWFWVLRVKAVNAEWERQLLCFYADLPAQVFTVVMDKKAHHERFGDASWNAYAYGLSVLLNRVRGYLDRHSGTADVMPESRGHVEDMQLLTAYQDMRQNGSTYGAAGAYRATYPEDDLMFRRKDQNVAGLQLADLIAADQKLLTINEAHRPLPHAVGPFGIRLSQVIENKVNRYGRYFLE